MPDSNSVDERTRREVENWLQTAADYRPKYALIYKRALAQPARWVPALIHHSMHAKAVAVKVAVRILRDLVHKTSDVDLLLLVCESLPRRSSVLADVSLEAAQKILDCFPPPERLKGVEAAMLWNNLAERMADADQPQKALVCAQQAVAVADTLTPQEKRVRVISRLTLSKCLARAGNPKDAEEAASTAFTLAQGPDYSAGVVDSALVAQSATIFANRLAESGKLQEAEVMAKMSARLIRETPGSPESQFDLAVAEHSLANQLTRQGLHDAALPHSENADRLFRILSSEMPDEYVEYAAAAASTYSYNLSYLGELQRAYDLAFANVERMRGYLKRQPKRFGYEFTVHLLAISDSAADLGRYGEATTFGDEALEQAIKLGRLKGRREWYLEGQANTNLFNLYYRLREFDAARKAARDAERAFARAEGSHPEAAMERIRALRNLAEAERILAQHEDFRRALTAARRSLELLEMENSRTTDAWLMLEAHCLTTFAACLEDAGRLPESLDREWESLKLRRRLFERSAVMHQTDVAYSLAQLARRFLKNGHAAKAKPIAEEAVSHYEKALERASERVIASMADALLTLSQIQVELRDFPEGIATLVRGIRLLRARYEKDPDAWLTNLLSLCAPYVELCGQTTTGYDATLVEDVILHAKLISTKE